MDRLTPDQTRHVYETHAATFDQDRGLFERAWLERFTARLAPGAKVLDLGCGTGQPIAAWLLAQGFAVTGVDYAAPMLDIARHRWPDTTWHHADMRALDLGQTFDAIIAWHSFFHLTQSEQRSALARIADHLAPNGPLMFTAGPTNGETTGQIAGQTVYHASLSLDEYTDILNTHGLGVTTFTPEDPDCHGDSVLLARKRAT